MADGSARRLSRLARKPLPGSGGVGRASHRGTSSRATRASDSDVSAIRARQSRVKSSTTVTIPKRWPSVSWSDTRSEDQRWFGSSAIGARVPMARVRPPRRRRCSGSLRMVRDRRLCPLVHVDRHCRVMFHRTALAPNRHAAATLEPADRRIASGLGLPFVDRRLPSGAVSMPRRAMAEAVVAVRIGDGQARRMRFQSVSSRRVRVTHRLPGKG